MKNHRILTIIVFLVLAFVLYKLGKTFLDNKQIPDPVVQTQNTASLVDMSFVTEVPIATASKYNIATGSYPQFRNADPSFNDKIRNAVVIAQSELENNARENWNARIKTAGPNEKVGQYPNESDFYFSLKTDYIQVNTNVISFVMTVSGFSGGAHGYNNLISYNYDVQKNTEITLADIFSNDKDYLKKVADFSNADLLTQFLEKLKSTDYEDPQDYNLAIKNTKEMLNDGTKPTLENFSTFTILPDAINIYFGEYQVAPYVYGPQMVKMPLQ